MPACLCRLEFAGGGKTCCDTNQREMTLLNVVILMVFTINSGRRQEQYNHEIGLELRWGPLFFFIVFSFRNLKIFPKRGPRARVEL